MKKVIRNVFMLIMVICTFSYMGVVKAANSQFFDGNGNSNITGVNINRTAVIDLLLGGEITNDDKTALTSLIQNYDLYYQYAKIDSDTYSKYKNNDADAKEKIVGLIKMPSSKADLTAEEKGWTLVDASQLKVLYNLDYSASSTNAYLVTLIAASKTGSTLYEYSQVFESTSSSTLYLPVSKPASEDEVDQEETDGEDVEKEDTDEAEETTETEEKAESNPETGISDYAMYLVPISLIAGSTLMIKRRNA